MSFASIMLRLVVALLLVLNGIGGAAASARMLAEHGTSHATAAPAPVPTAHADCHDGQDAVEAAPDPAPHARADASDGGYGCCESDTCLCECVQHCCAMPALAVMPRSAPAVATVVHPLSDGHPEPASHRLIRPPIA